ncbi:hypothetical protein QIA36_06885 (plasmid) [Borreliella yangtzensis]|uniref:hypothetical protein n=1 Tax=Borreliella yangtzensis TaxID=683292 RepID=UPI003B2114BD
MTNINKILKDIGVVNSTKEDVQEKIGDPTWNLYKNIDQSSFFEDAIDTEEDLLLTSLGDARWLLGSSPSINFFSKNALTTGFAPCCKSGQLLQEFSAKTIQIINIVLIFIAIP